MSFFDILKKEREKAIPFQNFQVTTKKIELTPELDEFFAFDIETTGLNPVNDKIIEIGLVHFSKGHVVDTYNALVKIDTHIPEQATKVNHITDEMLKKEGKDYRTVYKEVVQFIGANLTGTIPLVAHNAGFDTGFLATALTKLGFDGEIHYIDTLSESRTLVKGLKDYKQPTVAKYFGIVNEEEHRALTDAKTCGEILLKLIECIKNSPKEKTQLNTNEMSYVTDEAMEIGAILINILSRSNNYTSKVRLIKDSANYIHVSWVYPIVKFKMSKKGNYIILPKTHIKDITLKMEECSKAENEYLNKRIYFDTIYDLESIADIITDVFDELVDNNRENLAKYEGDFLNRHDVIHLSQNDITKLIHNAKLRSIMD